MEVELHAFLISAVGGVEWSDSRSGGFIREGRAPPPVAH
jgi:hypothetical protein